MEALKQRILNEGISLGSDRINVDGFINHKIDTAFMEEIGKEFGRRFADVKVDKILTVEASGIAIAMAALDILIMFRLFSPRKRLRTR